MSSFSVNADELSRRVIESRLSEVNVSEPGTVVKFNPDSYTVDVKLGAKRPVPKWDGSVGYEERPVIPAVPIATLGSTRTYNRPDIQVGDFVWVIFATVSPAEFLENGELSEPGDTSRQALSGGIAIPFTLPGRLSASPKTVLGGSGADYLAKASITDARLDALENWAKTHTHICAAPGNPSAVAVPTISPGSSTATTETKAL